MDQATHTTEITRPALEVADIFRAHSAEYLATHRVSEEQRRAIQAIIRCRTAALGGHVEECDACGAQRIAYNSCRNRHCPKCQGVQQALWVEARQAELLPLEYFHVVFTLPHELNELARWFPREVYDLLFAAAHETLQTLARRELGGELGITAVLHTWGQTLQTHIHLHCLVTGGALSDDETKFQRCPQGLLFRVEALSAVFRARYCAGLQQWAAELAAAGDDWQALVAQLAGELRGVPWVVYAKRPLAGPEQVLAYLGRYTQRVALSNARLLELKDGVVSFQYKDYWAGGVTRVMRLPALEFLRRFLQHVLPAGYVRIRHYGLLASRERERKLARCRELLGVAARAPVPGASWAECLAQWLGRAPQQCAQCAGGTMQTVAEWRPGESPPAELWGGRRCAA
jgi:hypothetical protein